MNMLPETTDAVLRTLAASYIPLAADPGGDAPRLLCPICHDDYVHPTAARILPPGHTPGLLAVTSGGVALDPDVPPIGRGVIITLTFVCEHGHTFSYEFAFHKGQTFVRRRPGRDIGPCEAPDTIWRN